jgi:glutamyl-tRNA synthetase
MTEVRTRFAPSPTGYLHIGGARTALFSWLYARHTNGKFILRIEDTDAQRSTEEATSQILESMEWLGLNWDEGPFYQSKRLDIYRSYVQKLLDAGKAYWCECTPDDLEKKREIALSEKRKPKYDGTCRHKGHGPGPGRVVRLAVPFTGVTAFDDMIKGRIAVNNDELDDLIILRSDGMPTYNFTVVIDDATMNITHVIRGDDHVNNTPRQIIIYEALGFELPQFAHVPMILGPDKTKLSKRHGATSAMVYKEMGYLPEALVNYLVRLSWSHGDQEIFSLQELIEFFDVHDVGSSAAVFNTEKLLWLNQYYIKKAREEGRLEELSALLKPIIQERGYVSPGANLINSIITDVGDRAKTLVDIVDIGDFYFKENIEIPEDLGKKFFTPEIAPYLAAIIDELGKADFSDKAQMENAFNHVLEDNHIKFKIIAQPVRIALTGKTMSPGIFEMMETLGKDKVISRLKAVLK